MEILTSNIQCSSIQPDTVKVEIDCSQIYLDGTETTGGETNIIISSSSSILNRGVNPEIAVWYPTDVTITSTDNQLNLVDYSCNATSRLYQSTPLYVSAKFNIGLLGAEEFTADVTSRANVSLFIYLFVSLFVYLFVCLLVYLHVYLLICLLLRLSICLLTMYTLFRLYPTMLKS